MAASVNEKTELRKQCCVSEWNIPSFVIVFRVLPRHAQIVSSRVTSCQRTYWKIKFNFEIKF